MLWVKLEHPPKGEWKKILKEFEKENGFSFTRRPRYFIDENLGQGTTELIRSLKYNVTDAWETHLTGKGDEHIWRFCQKDRRILLSHDNDFLNENLFPIRKSFGFVLLPHKTGEETPLIRKIVHLTSFLSIGTGIIYEKKITIRENGHWQIFEREETGAIISTIYDLSNRHHVFELKNEQ